MSLLLLEGFEGSDSNERSPYLDWAQRNTSYARTGSYGIRIYASGGRIEWLNLTADPTMIIGFGFLAVGLTPQAGDICRFKGDGGATDHNTLKVSGTGQLHVDRGSTTIASSAVGVIKGNTWHYVEVKILMSDTVGTVDVQVDGVNVISATGLDTKNGGTVAAYDAMHMYGTGNEFWVDDVYICNGAGGVNDDFFGPIWVETLVPNGNGNYSDMLGSDADSVDNYLLVDELVVNDADYIGSATVTDKDTFTMQDVSAAAATIHGVEARLRAYKTDSGAKSIRAMLRRATTDAAGAVDHSLAETAWGGYAEIWDIDPVAAAAWTVANINATEFGAEVRT